MEGAELLTISSGVELNDGTRIPRMGFGTFQLGKGKETQASVEAALSLGYRHLDCARIYDNERSVGGAIVRSGIKRAELYITSKVWNDRQLHGGIRESVLETLDALGIEQLNLLLIHWPVRDRYRFTWETFQEIQQEGLTQSIGVSNFTEEHLADLLSDGSAVPAVNQIEHNIYMQYKKALAYCKQNNIAIEAWAPFGAPACSENPIVVELGKKYRATPRQIMLAWQLCSDIIPLPRTKSASHAEENIKALEINLSDEEITLLNTLNKTTPREGGIDPAHFNEIFNGIVSPRD